MREERVVESVVELEMVILKNRNGVVTRSVFFELNRPILKIREVQKYKYHDQG